MAKRPTEAATAYDGDEPRGVDKELLTQIANEAANTGELDLTEIHADVPVAAADIAASTQDFHSAATVLSAMHMPYPMVQISGIGWAPLDLVNLMPAQDRPPFASPADIVTFAQSAAIEVGQTNMLFNTMPVPQARRTFADGLVDFLRVRIDAAKGLLTLGGEKGVRRGTTDVPGLDITVHNRQQGLRIHFAKAYFPAMNQVFGNALSPVVRGYLPPGRYIFGAGGPGVPIFFEDKAVYGIPPTDTIHMILP